MDRTSGATSSSSMIQINECRLFIPQHNEVSLGGRVVSLPTLEIFECSGSDPIRRQNVNSNKFGKPSSSSSKKDSNKDSSNTIKATRASMDDLNKNTYQEYPESCMHPECEKLKDRGSCSYIQSSSSSSSSSNSLSISDPIHLVQKLTSVYENQDSQSLLDSDLLNQSDFDNSTLFVSRDFDQTAGEISFIVPAITPEAAKPLPTNETAIEIDLTKDNEEESASSISPTHCKIGVPSKAAAILGAKEIFMSPSHAAYRRLVDYTHRPFNDAVNLFDTNNSNLPNLAHVSSNLFNINQINFKPSLTVRSQRIPKPMSKPQEVSPEKKQNAKYKIKTLGIDEVKDKLKVLRKPLDSVQQVVLLETSWTKSNRMKDFDKLAKSGKISTHQIAKWNVSFENLLHDKYGLALFHEYLKSEYSEENIEFWIACEEFRTITNLKKMLSRAQKIVRDFVTTQAPKEVNIDSKTRQITLESMQHPDPNMFDMAQKRIQTLMEIDSYQRFLRSEMYQNFVKENAQPVESNLTCSQKPKEPSIHSAQCSFDYSESDVVQSLHDVSKKSSSTGYKEGKSDSSSTSIVRISSMKSPKCDVLPHSHIHSSSSDHYLHNVIK